MSKDTKKVLDRCEKHLALLRKYPHLAPSIEYNKGSYGHFSVRLVSPISELSDEEMDRLLKK